MKNYKQNKRTCIIDKKKYIKSELIRIVLINNELKIDKIQNIKGRGCYLNKNNLDKINKILKKKLFNKAFKRAISENEYLKIINYLKGVNENEEKAKSKKTTKRNFNTI